MSNNNSRLNNLGKNDFGSSITKGGIYRNCQVLANYVTNTSKTGNQYKAFTFEVTTEDGSSKTFNIMKPSKGFPREVEIVENGIKRMKLETDKEALIRAEDTALEYADKLVKLVDPNELVNVEGETFDELAIALVKIINDNQVKYNPKFDVKVVLDKDYKYTNLPNYAGGTFALYKEGAASKLRINERDRITPPAQIEDPTGNSALDNAPLSGPATPDSDLPF
jgi:hypothetical protein